MKKYFLLFWVIVFLLLFFGIHLSFGQNPLVKQWDKRFGGNSYDEIFCIKQTIDDGYILGGTSSSNIGVDKSQQIWGFSDDFWIVKIDTLGNKQWDKDFGGFSGDYLSIVLQTSDRGFLLGGTSSSGIGGDKTQDSWNFSFDYWIVKIDSVGNKQWDYRYGGAENDQLLSLQKTHDGGFILGGWSFSSLTGDKTQSVWGGYDFWILKIDSTGIILWDKDFGGTSDDLLYSLQETSDGGYILGGKSFSRIGGDKSQDNWDTSGISSDYWIIKVDSLGNKQWDKDFGGTNNDFLISLLQTNDKGFILGGISNSGIGGDKMQNTWGYYDYWVVKIDSLGNKQWDKDFGGALDEDEFREILQTIDHGYIMSGTSYSPIGGDKTENNFGPEQAWIVKIDSLGVKQWDKTLLTNSTLDDETGLAIQSIDGCYLMASSTHAGIGGDKSQNSQGLFDYWIIKFCDTTQMVINYINLSSSDTNFCDKQYIDFYDLSTNNPTSWQWLFPGGSPSSSTQQNPVGIYYNSYGSFDVTLIACNASGCDSLFLPNFIHEFQSPPVPVITWAADTLYSTPAFSYQWYFNSSIIPGATGQYYVFQQPGNYFVIVTDSNGCATSSSVVYTGIEEANTNMEIYVIPNPTDGDFNIYGAPVYAMAKIYDLTGRLLYSCKIKSSPQKINFKATDGLYYLEISKSEMLMKKKIMIKN